MASLYTRLTRIATTLERRVQLETEIEDRLREIAVIDAEIARLGDAPREGGDDEISQIETALRLVAEHAAKSLTETSKGG